MFRSQGIRGLMLSTTVVALLSASACSDDDEPAGAAGAAGTGARGGSSGASGSSGRGGSGATSGRGGNGGTVGAAGTVGAGGTGNTDAGDGSVDSGGAGGAGGTTGTGGSAGTPTDAGDGGVHPYAAFSPLPAVPADPTNTYADSAAAAALGQKLFFDQNFSGKIVVASDLGAVDEVGKVSCASCHSGPGQDDVRSSPDNISMGTNRHTRNSPSLINASFYAWTNWAGRFAAQWELPLAVAESPVIMNGNRLQIAHRIFDVYKTEYEAVFGAMEPELGNTTRFPPNGKPKGTNPTDGPWETAMTDADRTIVNRILVNYSKAIAAYMRLLVSRDAPFDKWVAGDNNAISEAAKRGADLFRGKANCTSCHSGPHFSDDKFHNIGVQQTGPNVPAADLGRFTNGSQLLTAAINVDSVWSDKRDTGKLAGLTNPMPDSTKNQFRTPDLRGVALTAPYMHAGQFATLEAVIDFYNAGATPDAGAIDPEIQPLNLSTQEKADLVEFLKTLSGAQIPANLLVDSTP